MTESGRDHEGADSLDPDKWLRGALATTPIDVIVVDRRGIIRAANHQANDMFGYRDQHREHHAGPGLLRPQSGGHVRIYSEVGQS